MRGGQDLSLLALGDLACCPAMLLIARNESVPHCPVTQLNKGDRVGLSVRLSPPLKGREELRRVHDIDNGSRGNLVGSCNSCCRIYGRGASPRSGNVRSSDA